VSLIVAFYLLCTYQCLRIWICRKCFGREVGINRGAGSAPAATVDGQAAGEAPAHTVLVHEGRAFNLSGDQRRQVLEVIFSESSKVRYC
jgi:hypothetical protein